MANLQDSINRAKKLIQMDAKGDISQKAKNAIKENKINTSFEEDDEYGSARMPLQRQPKTDSLVNELDHYTINENTMQNCKGLPLEVMQSFKEKRIDTALLNPMDSGGSVLDELQALTKKPNQEKLQETKQYKQQPIVEQYQQTQPINTTIQPTVDYSIIKMIVEDCMKKSLSSIKKTINESRNIELESNNLQALKIGEKFSFITENGDLYEAKLEFKKNIKKK